MKSFTRHLRDMTTRMKIVTFLCAVFVACVVAMQVVPLVRDQPIDIMRIPSAIWEDGATYQVTINLDEPIDKDLLVSIIEGSLSNYITK